MPHRFEDVFDELPKETQALLIERYGGRKPGYWRILAILILAIGLPWLMWSAWYHSNPEARITLVSFRPIDSRSIEITFDLTRKDPEVAQVCTLIARDFDKNVVGEIDVVIPPTPKVNSSQNKTVQNKTVQIKEVIPTRLAAVNAGVLRCTEESGK